MRRKYVFVLLAGLVVAGISLGACERPQVVEEGVAIATPELLEKHCRDVVGPPRVEQISEHVWAAIGTKTKGKTVFMWAARIGLAAGFVWIIPHFFTGWNL